jgi:hypothetical protein
VQLSLLRKTCASFLSSTAFSHVHASPPKIFAALLMASALLLSLPQLTLVLLLCWPNMSPLWYYRCASISGIVAWGPIGASAMSDVLPPEARAAGFGISVAGYSLSVSVAPFLALWGHLPVAMISLGATWTALLTIVFLVPETLSTETAMLARAARSNQVQWLRPIWELSILARSSLFRLLCCVAFCSDAASAGV